MYRVWPCPLTRTVPTPGTLFTLIVTEAADEVPADPLPGEPTAPFEGDELHAATAAAAPARGPQPGASSCADHGRVRRCSCPFCVPFFRTVGQLNSLCLPSPPRPPAIAKAMLTLVALLRPIAGQGLG